MSLLSLLELSGCALSIQSGNCTLSGQYGDQQSCQTKNPSANCSLSTAVSPDGQPLACWKATPKVTTNQNGVSATVCTSTWEEGVWGNCDGKFKYRSVTCKAGCTCDETKKPATTISCGDFLAGGFHTKQECLANRDAKIELMNGESYCGMSGSSCPTSWRPLTKDGISYTITDSWIGMAGCGAYINDTLCKFAFQNDKPAFSFYGVEGHTNYQPIKPESRKICVDCMPVRDRYGEIISGKCKKSSPLTVSIRKLLCY